MHTTHPTVKLRPKHYGPFKVIEVLGPTTYHLELLAQWKIHNVFHGSLLLPYYKTKEHGCNFPEPAPDLIEGQPEWEVKEILDSRRYRCKLQYLIRWKGYSDAHNSWEPKEDVNIPVLLTAFYGQNPGAIRKLEMGSLDCSQGALPLETKECTKKLRTQSRFMGHSQMNIRSVRIVNERTSMSSDCTPANPLTPPPHSPQNDGRPSTFQQAVDILTRNHQRHQRPEVSVDTLQ